MTRRAESVDETRQRIIEATVHLHGTVGIAATSISAVAERAGVTRLTVYRHFPDDATLIEACSAHWLSQQRPPAPASWTRHGEPLDRLRAALDDVYRFYREGEAMLTFVYRDLAAMPEGRRTAIEERDRAFVELVLEPFAAGGPARTRLRAAVGHALTFGTWRSLCVEQGLANADAVEMMVRWIAALTVQPQPEVR